jgi:RimJ/RimL family protein N-acetyltransferase
MKTYGEKSATSRRPQRPARPTITREQDLPLAVSFGNHAMLLRSVEPGDTSRLIEFFESHTPETIHQRYGYAVTRMTPERADRLINVDRRRDVALGVFENEGGCSRLVAIGRYCLDALGHAAEVAFVVREDRRRLHIATTLLEILRVIARERGLEKLHAQVQMDNEAMLAVFRAAGAELRGDDRGGVVVATMPMTVTAEKSPTVA